MGNAHANRGEVLGEDGETPRLYALANIKPGQWPIIYSPTYNIGFMGLERIHPFDSAKWGKVFKNLVEEGMFEGEESIVSPHEVNQAELRVVHTDAYLDSLNSSYNVALVVEVPPVAILPNSVVQNRMLKPFRFHTGGTIMAGKLAKERGWAINIGGGFHHCSGGQGGGFCAYADITLCIKFMFQYLEGISKVMIVDFDAHQGNGHERDFIGDEKVYIMDMYNRWIYPNDSPAKAAITKKIELDVHTGNEVYLEHIRRELPRALDDFKPDMVVYNAGTDVLKGDPLGVLDITPEGVRERDQIVFSEVRSRDIPIVMVTSGGYQRNNADVISASIINLKKEGLIKAPEDDPHVTSELRRQGAPLRTGSESDSPPSPPTTPPGYGDDPTVDEETQEEEKLADQHAESAEKESSDDYRVKKELARDQQQTQSDKNVLKGDTES